MVRFIERLNSVQISNAGNSSVVVVGTFGGKVGNFVVEAHGFPTFRKSERVRVEGDEHGAHA